MQEVIKVRVGLFGDTNSVVGDIDTAVRELNEKGNTVISVIPTVFSEYPQPTRHVVNEVAILYNSLPKVKVSLEG